MIEEYTRYVHNDKGEVFKIKWIAEEASIEVTNSQNESLRFVSVEDSEIESTMEELMEEFSNN